MIVSYTKVLCVSIGRRLNQYSPFFFKFHSLLSLTARIIRKGVSECIIPASLEMRKVSLLLKYQLLSLQSIGVFSQYICNVSTVSTLM